MLLSAFSSEIEVLYGGTEIFDYEVEEAIAHDEVLAGVSLALVAPLIFVLSGFSLSSTIIAILTLFSCFPYAYFVYRVVLGIEAVGLLNLVSLFVIIGIGVDDVFVFLNTFKQAGDLKGVRTLQDRLAYTIIHASKATFLTSATTAVAFFANAFSAVCTVVCLCVIVCFCVCICMSSLCVCVSVCACTRLCVSESVYVCGHVCVNVCVLACVCPCAWMHLCNNLSQ